MNKNINDYYIALITIVVTLNGIGIPLSYNIVSENFRDFLDKNLYKILLEEKRFQRNVIVSFFGLIVFGFPLIFDFSKFFSNKNLSDIVQTFSWLYLGLSIFTIVGFLISFVEFSEMIYQYASNSEEIIFAKTKEQIDEQLK